MDTAVARARLERMLQITVDPVLTTAEVDDLMILALRTDASGYTPYDRWAASTIYTVQAYRVPTVSNGHQYIVTTAGTSGTVEPTWPTTSGATVTDGTVVWTERGAYLYTATFDLRAAAREGWRWKYAKIINDFDVAAGGGTNFLRSQKLKHIESMIRFYGGGVSGGGGGIGAVQLTHDYANRWNT